MLFERLRLMAPQWLAAVTLGMFIAVVVLSQTLACATAPLVEKTGMTLTTLQLSGWHGVWDKQPSADDVLKAWTEANVIGDARRAQSIDFLFAAAYGVLSILIAAALWRGHPNAAAGRGRWIWLIALGAVAALCDEVENVSIWRILGGHATAGVFFPTAPATVKIALIGISALALLAALVSTIRRRSG